MTQELLDIAIRIARDAGELLAARQGAAGMVTYKSSATDPVSEADKASEELITAALGSARPDDALLGEEGSDAGGSTGLRWVIDPLDGTVNYLYGMPAWSVSIACEDDDGALVGVVHQPAAGLTFTARRGHGAACSGRAIAVNDPVPLARALILTGFSYDVGQRTRQAAVVAKVLPQVRDIRRIGSAALDLCMVGAGMADAYYEDTTARWDWAAGALVAAEAGATVRVTGDELVVAGPSLFPAFAAALDAATRDAAAGNAGSQRA